MAWGRELAGRSTVSGSSVAVTRGGPGQFAGRVSRRPLDSLTGIVYRLMGVQAKVK
ncbi:hypothetical protein GCM10022222_57610 [Amycolatopsis ultiminotia]|uniref:Uncharacterized protein n=1 Tax=Amycolatopsis ultiminotia TaxID=543629 RepID=A0ABP6XF81_9PSEU